jgi:hypothetical protein
MSWHFEGRYTSRAKARAALEESNCVPHHVADAIKVQLQYLPEAGLNQHVHVKTFGHIYRSFADNVRAGTEYGNVLIEVNIHQVHD